MRTQQKPGAGSRRAVSRSLEAIPSSSPSRKSRFMPHTVTPLLLVREPVERAVRECDLAPASDLGLITVA